MRPVLLSCAIRIVVAFLFWTRCFPASGHPSRHTLSSSVAGSLCLRESCLDRRLRMVDRRPRGSCCCSY
jgi:hypothetical protein